MHSLPHRISILNSLNVKQGLRHVFCLLRVSEHKESLASFVVRFIQKRGTELTESRETQFRLQAKSFGVIFDYIF